MAEPRAIIADDEEPLRIYLRSRLREVWPELTICGEARNGVEALQLIEETRPDIAFLDIKMPGLSGMEVAERVSGSCRVVFVTAFNQHAVEAFENEAIDYLLKPVTIERLQKTVDRLKERLTAPVEPLANIAEIIERTVAQVREKDGTRYLQWIKAQAKESIRLIPVEEVYFFQSRHKYTVVVTQERESLIKTPIQQLEQELDPDKFWRIHRGTIVNASFIDKVSSSSTGRGVLKLRGRTEFHTVSRSYAHIFKMM